MKYIYIFFSINIYFYYYIIKEFHGQLKSKDNYFMFCQAPHLYNNKKKKPHQCYPLIFQNNPPTSSPFLSFFFFFFCVWGEGMVGALCGPKVVKPLSPPFFYRSFLSPMAHFLL